jgi:N-acetyl-anhydromuramyl-L-alanine amidase AmpD
MKIHDVREHMPNYARYCDRHRTGAVTGIAVHHSATANRLTGLSMEDARTIFRYHVETLGWDHGGYHYLIHPNGLVEYALDERIPAFHAGFADSDNRLDLECGQYWNNHLLAVCLLGWFEHDRTLEGGRVAIPNQFTAPLAGQWRALIALLRDLGRRYGIGPEEVKGHRELAGCRTICPGANVDLDGLRRELKQSPAEEEH